MEIKHTLCVILTLASLLQACSDDRPNEAPRPGGDVVASRDALDYARVDAILEKRCAVCHACYDAPCQLNLSAQAGVFRGAHKTKVYDGARLTAAEPTRLLIDAGSTEAWRGLDFFPVLPAGSDTGPEQRLDNSLMYRLLQLKRDNPLPVTADGRLEAVLDLSLNREWACPTIGEFESYAEDHRYAGMPFGLPAIDAAESALLEAWIASGPREQQQAPNTGPFQSSIERWETFMNGDGNRARLAARYIYEHLFLGNIYFPEVDAPGYFKLVRSRTAPGEPLQRIATRRPYDDPGVERVYYRLIPVETHIVAKTHMPYAFDTPRLARFKELFLAPDYRVEELSGYAPETASNPFMTFRQIPARQRYRFMLEHAQFTIRGFMKGAVCRGQVALNVIDDHFWVYFASPDSEAIDHFDDLLAAQAHNLSLPAAEESTTEPVLNWLEFAERQKTYLDAKTRMLNQRLFNNRPLDQSLLWDGDGNNSNAALTVFRHFDSASVRRGLLGRLPKTAWLIDYPILERIHYLLVAGFDVYGNVGHQLLTRMYMDFLRMESEFNYLGLLPAAVRGPTRDYWYRDADQDVKDFLQGDNARFIHEPDIEYRTNDHQRELADLLRDYLEPALRGTPGLSASADLASTYRRLRALESLAGRAASLWPESSVLLVDGERPALFTILRHSAHSNISGLFDEALRRLPEEDSIDVFPGVVGAYPDAYWRIDAADLDSFTEEARAVSSQADYRKLMRTWGVRRSNPDFWAHSDRVHEIYSRDYPIEYGLLDYNRLENR